MVAHVSAQTSATKPSSTAPATTHTTTHKAATTAHKPGTTTKAAPKKMTLTTEKEKFSYALGMKFGDSLKSQKVDVDPALFAQGVRDMFAGTSLLMTKEQAQAVLTQMQAEMRAKAEAGMKEAGAVNKKAGDEFLKNNATQKDVVVLPSGLQYKILKQGTGPKPTVDDTVVCNYRGTLIDGKEFDSSYKRGEPATFPLNRVIKGWTEALQLMPVGSKWQLFIPPNLAYGEQAPPEIGPDSTLVFEVELLSIEPKK